MEVFIIRNQRQNEELRDRLLKRRLPYAIAIKDIYPKRSVDLNAYLWHCVYKPIAKFTGHSIKEVHDGYKHLFNLRYDLIYNSKLKTYELKSEDTTTTLSYQELWDYAMQVRADAELELSLTLELPNEAFIPELNFEFENNNEVRRL